MVALMTGLLIFLGAHSVRICAEDWRTAQIARRGASRWKGVCALLSIIGFALLIWGYGQARVDSPWLWVPPLWTRHLAALLTLPAFVMLAAASMPPNAIRARLRHPMILGVKLWAFAHLLANGQLADVVLFGGFLLWAIFDYRAARRRDRRGDLPAPIAGGAAVTLATVLVGGAAWAAFAFWLHRWLIGVAPLGV